MIFICLQRGHQNIQANCYPDMRGGTGAPGEAGWTPTMSAAVTKLLRAQRTKAGAIAFNVVEVDANVNCAATHPFYSLTLAIHYQSNTGHSGFGVFVPDASVDRDSARSVQLAKAISRVYAARTGLPNYSSPRLGLNRATWENPNTLFYYVWSTQNGPLALIECGEGASGAPDHTLLYTQIPKLAAAIAEGICLGFGVPFVDPAVVAAQAAAKAKADALAAAQKAAMEAKAAADAAAAVAAADAAAKAAAAAQAQAEAEAAAKAKAEADHAAAAAAAEAALQLPPVGFWEAFQALLRQFGLLK